MTSFVNVCDVKSVEKRYTCLKIVNNKTKMNMTCVSSHRCLGSLVIRKKEFQLKGLISLVNLRSKFVFMLGGIIPLIHFRHLCAFLIRLT